MKKPVFHILLIAIIGLLAYYNTFSVPFHFDDSPNIVENPIIKDLRYFANPASATGFQLYDAFKSRFIGYLSFALNYQLHGLDVTGYHIVNLAIHIINALLVYWLVVLTFQTPYFSRIARSSHTSFAKEGNFIALFSALFFVSHPIQTQAVTYIIQRLASLATMFYLLSLVMYIKARRGSQNREDRNQITDKKLISLSVKSVLFYLTSVVSAVLAMKTKEIAFTLPVIITIYEFLFFEGKIKTRLLYLLPLLFTMLIIPLSLISVDKPIGELIGDVGEATRLQTTVSRWDYLFTQFRVIVTYIRLIFLPIYQNLDYDYPARHSFFEPAVFLSFLFLLSIVSLGIYLLYRPRLAPSASRLAAFGIFWFFITLTVESGIIPIVDVIFEHRVYLPLAGAFIAITTSAFIIANKLKNLWALGEKAVFGVLALTVIVLVVATHARNIVWQDNLTLWEDAAKKSPGKPRVHNNLGLAYAAKGLRDDAIKHYKIALELAPDFAEAHNNIGVAYALNHLSNIAIGHYRIALRLKPDYVDAHFNLAMQYLDKGDLDNARKIFEAMLQISPHNSQALHFLNYIANRQASSR